jgi:YHS domain-containing protein
MKPLTIAVLSFIFMSNSYLPSNEGFAMGGNDIVSYYEETKPSEGNENFSYSLLDTTWIFKNKENLAKFQNDPESYLPQYQGWCGWALAEGRLSASDPNYYSLIDGKLYMMCSEKALSNWNQNTQALREKADANWEKILHQQN